MVSLGIPASKAELRRSFLAIRAGTSVATHATEAEKITSVAAHWAATTICAYLPCAQEPGALALLDMWREQGSQVLLPITPAIPGPLKWARYQGKQALTPGRFPGLLEPSGPQFEPEVISTAALIVVPAVAVDHSGVRLGRGGGYYDRSLPLAAPQAHLIGIVRDNELVIKLPEEKHDVLLTHVLTPSGGLQVLPLTVSSL